MSINCFIRSTCGVAHDTEPESDCKVRCERLVGHLEQERLRSSSALHAFPERSIPDFTLAMAKKRYDCSKAKALIYGDDGSHPSTPDPRGTKCKYSCMHACINYSPL